MTNNGEAYPCNAAANQSEARRSIGEAAQGMVLRYKGKVS